MAETTGAPGPDPSANETPAPEMRANEMRANRFVVAVDPLPVSVDIALPRYGNSTPEDALADAANRGSAAAVGRLQDQFSLLRFDLHAVNTDDNRLGIVDRTGAEDGIWAPLDRRQTVLDLIRVFGCPVRMLALSGPQDPHWVPWDMLIVQEHGTSTWRITEPTELSAVPGYTPAEPSNTEVWAGELRAGQAMYLPRGWGRQVFETSDDAACTAFELHRFTGLDIISELTHAGAHWPLLRADAPVDIAAQTDSYDEHLYQENHFGDALAELASVEQIDACLARLQVGVLVDQGATNGSWSPDSTTPIRLLAPTGVKWLDHDEEAFGVALAGHLVMISMEALPAFAELASGEPTRIVDLPLTVDTEGASILVSELQAWGLIGPA